MRKYKITRLYILTGKCRPKNKVKDIRCRYLAKSLLVRANSDNKKIEFTNFRGSHFKDVTFKSANFYGNDFWGATFNKCKFNNSKISSTIFVSCSFKKCDFSQTLFNNCIFINTNISECKNIDVSSGVNILKEYPHVDCSQPLLSALDILKENVELKKTKLLHLNKNRLNQLNIFLLLQLFNQDTLSKLLIVLNSKNCKHITTYKKLEKELKKITSNAII